MSLLLPSFNHRLLAPALAVGIALVALPVAARAQAVMSDPAAVDSVASSSSATGTPPRARPVRAAYAMRADHESHHERQHHGRGGHRHHETADHPGPRGGAFGQGGFGFLRGLDLSEAQRDRIFEIMHRQAPVLRESAKAVGRVRQELGALAMSGQYDEAKARSLSEALAGATAGIALERARAANAVWQVLSEEQRQQVQARRAGRS
jgi:Spy/CpxP family protein refolding chaperone